MAVNSTQLAARRITYFVWNRAGLEPHESIDHTTQEEYTETMQRIIEGTGPAWVLEDIPEKF